MLHRRDDTLMALLDGTVREANQKKLHATRDVHLNGDHSGIYTLQCGTVYLDQHILLYVFAIILH